MNRITTSFFALAASVLAGCGPSIVAPQDEDAVVGYVDALSFDTHGKSPAIDALDASACRTTVGGYVTDGGGSMDIQVDCAPSSNDSFYATFHVDDPRGDSPRVFERQLSDLSRPDDASAYVGVTNPIGTTSISVTELRGARAPLPKVVTDDFVRRFHLTAELHTTPPSTMSLDISLDVASMRNPVLLDAGK